LGPGPRHLVGAGARISGGDGSGGAAFDQCGQPIEYHVALGARLAALRDRGILVLGSGNLVHNLRAMDWKSPDAGFDWARAFNERAISLLRERPGDIASLQHHPEYLRAVPTPDHFLPLAYLAGVAAASGQGLDVLVDGYAYGSLSMTCFGIDAPCPDIRNGTGLTPLATTLPADQSNL
jgi:4,5-DOPA dioxygenase extradiol